MFQSHTRTIADAHPKDRRTMGRPQASRREVLVFGQDRHALRDGVIPYHRIARIAQSDIDDVQGFVSRPGKHALEPRRQLRIDEDSHRAAATRIG